MQQTATSTEAISTSVVKIRRNGGLKLELPVDEFRSIPIPGVSGRARLGVCFVKVTDVPGLLDDYMEINPRVPNRSKTGVLAGPVVKGIFDTLRDSPDEMVLKNQGIYILVESALHHQHKLTIMLSDPSKHGIVNGGHTYSAIREAVENADADELEVLKKAYVRLHIYQGIDQDYVPEIAEGLNRSRQVDDPSLVNLQGEFDVIRKALRGVQGADSIAYHQGDSGEVYVSEVLVYLSMFDVTRFTDRKQPNALYNRGSLGLRYFQEGLAANRPNMLGLIAKLPDFLWLADSIRKATPIAAKHNSFKFGQVKLDGKERAGGASQKGTHLPFLGETVPYRIPNGWVYPMLAAFRANIKFENGAYSWRSPLNELLPAVIDDLVGICVSEHRNNNMPPEQVGKRESAYNQCYMLVQLYLAKRNLLH